MSKAKARGNGTGTAIKRGDSWTSIVVIGYKPSPDGSHMIAVRKTKGGFKTKREALLYCPTLLRQESAPHRMTLNDVYKAWEPWYADRIIKSTMDGYKAAYGHFKPLHNTYIDMITAADLQQCMDDCEQGKRTHQNMKTTIGLIWHYAYDSGWVQKDVTTNLYIGKHESVQREPLTEKEIEAIRNAIGKERYAEYIYCLCFTGYRPGELLSLKKEHYRIIDGVECLVNGSKTEAGRDRVVVVAPQILDIIRSRLYVPGTDLLFPMYHFRRDGKTFKEFKPMNHNYFNRSVFKPMMARLGIAEGKVPYSARHSFADKLKGATGTDRAKSSIMGHTDYAFTQSHYQSTDIDDLLDVATSIR